MLIGPTASGKTAAAVQLALEIGGEVVSADSRQCFRELPISTAQPGPDEQRGVPHHFIGDRTLDQPGSAGAFAREAEDRIEEILARGRVPVVAGGSTLYLKALRDGIAALPPPDLAYRALLDERLAREGLPALAGELARRDPEAHATLDLKNPARVVRALEILEATGLSLRQAHERAARPPRYAYRITYLDPPREDLHRRIDARVLSLDRRGLRDEVQHVLAAGHSPALPVLRTIGIAEVIAHLSGGPAWSVTLADIQAHTRQYARRQSTYFRKFLALQ